MILTAGEIFGFSFSLTILAATTIFWFTGLSLLWHVFLVIGSLGLVMVGLHILKYRVQEIDQEVSNRKPDWPRSRLAIT